MNDDTELAMLRVFYTAWVALHSIPRDSLHRRKQEMAAQALVDCGHVLKLFYKGTKGAQTIRAASTPRLEIVHPESGCSG